MRIACASDIHGMWEGLNYPEADVLVFAGDILNNYGVNMLHDVNKQLEELERLNDFFGQLDYKEIIFVAGNHDWVFQIRPKSARNALSNAVYLQDEDFEMDGVKFYGSPWQPWFYDWAFNFPCADKTNGGNALRAKAHAMRCWEQIPDNTNVLITHGPRWGTLDKTYSGEMVGCQWLEKRVEELKELRLHIFGHIHYSYGVAGIKPMSINASVCGENYKPDNSIRVVNV